jgi:stress response protein YsnF
VSRSTVTSRLGLRCPKSEPRGAVTIVPIVEEVLVVEKRLLIKEEVHIRRRATTETADVPVMLRKQRAVIIARQEHLRQAGGEDSRACGIAR